VASLVDSKLAQQHAANNDYGNGWLKTHSAGSAAPAQLKLVVVNHRKLLVDIVRRPAKLAQNKRGRFKLNKAPSFILGEFGWTPDNIDQQFTVINDHQLEP
jgi:hypothetical protein